MKKNLLVSKFKLLALGFFAFSLSYAQTVTFNYTGTVQTYTVPAGCTSITVDVYGAQGGFGYNVPLITPGLGGRVQATVAVTPLEVLTIYVGGQGGPGGTTVGGTAGYNGGGTGGGWAGGRSGGGGGGASDIRQGGTALANRVIVGSGGGGTGVNHSSGDAGGNGGGLTGSNGLTGTYLGAGATQSAGGAPNGALGNGGNAPAGQTGGGGGGGYYGGGSSAWEGGGGGSSYASTLVATAVTHTAGARTGNGQITITPIIPFNATVSQTAFISCFGQSTASLTAATTGGTSPFTYSWAPTGGNTATATGLAAGTYTVTVTDATSAVTTQTFAITQPTAVTTTSTSVGNLCFGGNSGSATVSASGGTPGYTYAWSNGGNTATITNLIAGAYTYTVTDTQGCSSIQSVTVTQPTALSAAASQTDVTCNGGGTGDATVTVSGGTGPYSYSWAPSGGTGSTEINITAGTYTCSITDANGCNTTQTFSITEPSAVVATATAGSILCNGGSTTVTVNATGGVGSYTGTGTFTENVGLITYTVTDGNGCATTATVLITEPDAIVVASTQYDVSCNGNSTGIIDLTVSGGTGSYTFDWNNGQFTTEDLTGIPAGTYSGVLTDANGCQDSVSFVITEPPLLVATTVISDPTTCGGTDGFINTNVSGGTPAYSYSWSNSSTNSNLTGVGAGVYGCTVIDLNGCTTQFSATLSDPAAPTVTVSLLIDTVCVTDGAYALTGGSPSGGTFSGPGVSANAFNPATAGNGLHSITYTYTDSQTGCSGTNTDVVFVDACTGFIENVFASSFSVFPNPNNGTFTLQLNTTEIADVLIYDAVGKLVSATKQLPNMQQQISIESAGVYMITVVTADGNRSSQRVVVSK